VNQVIANVVRRLHDTARAFAIELAEPDEAESGRLGDLERGTALAELALLAGYRPGLLRYASRSLGPCAANGADELLDTAALWAVFAGGD
jgi:hypothetical protein